MAYDPSPIRRDSVITQAAQEICRLIEAERLGAGDALPTETRLAELLGVSRNSVREALRVLHGLGYVEKAAGRRVIVTAAAPGGKGVFDESVIIEAAPVANDVRSHIAQNAPSSPLRGFPLPSSPSMEGALAVALEAAIARKESDAAKSAHDAFHGQFLAGARNPLLVGDVQPGAGRAAVQCLAQAQQLLRSAPPRAASRAAARAAQARCPHGRAPSVRKHFQSLGLMLEVAARASRKSKARRSCR